jgi:hypothetical protein
VYLAVLLLQEGFGSLAVSVTGAGAAQEGKDYVRKHQELHGEHDMPCHGVLCRAVRAMPCHAKLQMNVQLWCA